MGYLSEARKLAGRDPAAALELLRGNEAEADYIPAGRFLELVCRRALDGEDRNAEMLALAEQCPGFFPAYDDFFDHCGGVGPLLRAARMLLGAVAADSVAELPEGKIRILVRAAFIAADDRSMALLETLALADEQDPKKREQLNALHFSREVRRQARAIDIAEFDGWYFYIGDTEDRIDTDGDLIGVNLAHLEVTDLAGWDMLSGANLIRAQFIAFESPFHFKYVMASFGRMAGDGRHRNRARLIKLLGNTQRQARREARVALPPIDNGSPEDLPSNPMADLTEEGVAWVRPGSAELHALWSYFDDRERTLDAAEAVAERSERARDRDDWGLLRPVPGWAQLDTRLNVTRLSLNAGWYAPPGGGAAAFEDWALRYTEGLSRNNILQAFAEEMLALEALHSVVGNSRVYRRNLADIARLIFSRSIVLVTAYADDIRAHRDAGNLERLWRHNGMEGPMRGLTLVDAPMSIWPYKPHGSWSETFEILRQDCDRAIESSGADLFLASCGCYGLPIVDHVNRKHGIRALYTGHAINGYFGVVTNTRPVFPQARQPSELYIKGGLGERYPHVGAVDGGRYLS